MQLRLVDAAHILPVEAPNSVDDVTNGIALSPSYHRAFDHGLIYVTDDLRTAISDERVERLRSEQLTAGFDRFRESIGRRLHLPPDLRQRPAPAYLRAARRFRGVE